MEFPKPSKTPTFIPLLSLALTRITRNIPLIPRLPVQEDTKFSNRSILYPIMEVDFLRIKP
jgi:hypothetical protein